MTFTLQSVVETSSDTPLEHRGLASVSEVISRSPGNSMDAELSFHIEEGGSVAEETVHAASLLSVFTHGPLTLTPLEGQETSQTPWRFPKGSQPGRWTALEGCLLGVV